MITIMPESHDHMIGFRLEGRLTADDYRNVLAPRMDELIERYGDDTIRVMLFIDENVKVMTLGALFQDTKFGIGHRGYHVTKLAIVGARGATRLALKMGATLTHAETETWPASAVEDAWAWLKMNWS